LCEADRRDQKESAEQAAGIMSEGAYGRSEHRDRGSPLNTSNIGLALAISMYGPMRIERFRQPLERAVLVAEDGIRARKNRRSRTGPPSARPRLNISIASSGALRLPALRRGTTYRAGECCR
jgi:hypothetical protein